MPETKNCLPVGCGDDVISPGGEFVLRSVSCISGGVAFAVACLAQPSAADPFPDLFAPWKLTSPYFGGGASITHHTGYTPGRTANAEQWVYGAKAFLGVGLSPVFSGEFSYHHFGDTALFGMVANEQSQAIAFSLLAGHTLLKDDAAGYPLLQPLYTLLDGTRLFIKSGVAHKWIDQSTPAGPTVSESGVTYLVGVGAERDLPHNSFMRLELEYYGKIGTSTAVNVQHTPITFSLGMRF